MSAGSSRLYYIDALRNFCMLYGIFVHAGTFFTERPFAFIATASDYFRMAAFFLVSGFLVALVGARVSTGEIVKRRALALLLPFATLVILVNPITNYLVYIRFNSWMSLAEYLGGGWLLPAEGVGVWHLHLWFLATLFLFISLYPALRRLAQARLVGWAVENLMKLPADLTIVIIGISCGIAVTILRTVFTILLSPVVQDTPFNWIILSFMIYVPYFALGMILEAHRPLFDRLHRISPLALGLSVLAIWGASMIAETFPGRVGTVAEIMADEFMTIGNIAAALWIARRLFQGFNPIVNLFSRAMYTIYLVHFTLIFALGHLLAPLITHDGLLYLVLSLSTIALGVAVHVGMVERSGVLRLFLNGRRVAPA